MSDHVPHSVYELFPIAEKAARARNAALDFDVESKTICDRFSEIANTARFPIPALGFLQGEYAKKLRDSLNTRYGSTLPMLNESLDGLHEAASFLVNGFGRYADRSEYLVRLTERVLQHMRHTVKELRALSSRVGQIYPQRWDARVPDIFPASATELVNGKYDSEIDSWRSLAAQHNENVRRFIQISREWADIEGGYLREMRTGRAKIERCFEKLQNVHKRLIESAPQLLDALNPQTRLSRIANEQLFALLSAAERSPQALSEKWKELNLSGQELDEFIRRNSLVLAGMVGLPTDIARRASSAVFEAAKKNPQKMYAALGLNPKILSFEDFQSRVQGLDRALNNQRRSGHAELLFFGKVGTEIGAIVSIGDIDTAEGVTVFVPGINSDVSKIEDGVHAIDNIQFQAQAAIREHPDALTRKTTAAAVFLAFDNANNIEEPDLNIARETSNNLRSFLTGIQNRPSGSTPQWVHLVGHSYGGTTGFETVKTLEKPIDMLTVLGAPGVDNWTNRSDLAARRIESYTGSDKPFAFPEDMTRILGRSTTVSHNLEPRDVPGVDYVSFPDDTFSGTHDLVRGTDNGYLSMESKMAKRLGEQLAGLENGHNAEKRL